MDIVKGKSRKNHQTKKSSRAPCRNLLKQASKVCAALSSLTKRKSWSCSSRKKSKIPAGCFAVYIGPEKQRFVVKTEFANHPLFKVLLEDAAMKYGYRNDGPMLLPCDVDLFNNVLSEIESCFVENMVSNNSWCLVRGFFGSAHPHQLDFRMNKGYGGDYRLLN